MKCRQKTAVVQPRVYKLKRLRKTLRKEEEPNATKRSCDVLQMISNVQFPAAGGDRAAHEIIRLGCQIRVTFITFIVATSRDAIKL